MQLHSQAHADGDILKTTSDGVPLSPACLAGVDGDILAAVGCALYTNAKSMAESFGLGNLHSVECHLSSGAVLVHRLNGCGDLWIHETQPLSS
ncbi:MAG: roadblock/LC7 domain-containing protein [Pseudomonadota bacterium]